MLNVEGLISAVDEPYRELDPIKLGNVFCHTSEMHGGSNESETWQQLSNSPFEESKTLEEKRGIMI